MERQSVCRRLLKLQMATKILSALIVGLFARLGMVTAELGKHICCRTFNHTVVLTPNVRAPNNFSAVEENGLNTKRAIEKRGDVQNTQQRCTAPKQGWKIIFDISI